MENGKTNRREEIFQQHNLLINRLIDYLKKEGYPEESIVTDWGNSGRIDLAVIEPESKTPIAIYEVKYAKNEQYFKKAISQLKLYTSMFNIDVRCNVILPSENEKGFDLFDVTKAVYDNEKTSLKDLEPESEQARFLPSAQSAKTRQELLSDKKKKVIVADFKAFCWKFIPVTSLILIILDRTMLLPFTLERLIVYAGTIAIMLLPFVNEIKMGNNSLVFKSNEKDEEVRFMDPLLKLINGIKTMFKRIKKQ